MESETWSGRVAVVTGAGSGIGAGIARAAGLAGMTVVVADLAEERANSVAAGITSAGGRAIPIRTDVTDERVMRELSDHVYSHIGEVRLLVNNAGIMNFGPSWEVSAQQWRTVLDVNIMGVLHGISAFLPAMVKLARSGNRSAVVNVASLASIAALPMSAAYVMSKHAVLALSECLSLELSMEELPIDVSVVLPGNIATQIYDSSLSSVGSVDTGARIKQMLIGMSSQLGMSPNDAGRIIFDKVRAREFWIATDPDLTAQTLAGRIQFLTAPGKPQLPPAMVTALSSLPVTANVT